MGLQGAILFSLTAIFLLSGEALLQLRQAAGEWLAVVDSSSKFWLDFPTNMLWQVELLLTKISLLICSSPGPYWVQGFLQDPPGGSETGAALTVEPLLSSIDAHSKPVLVVKRLSMMTIPFCIIRIVLPQVLSAVIFGMCSVCSCNH